MSDDGRSLGALLERTSRTFALAIPTLPEPRRREVTVAYLLFRIADTLEDAARWTRDQRVDGLHELARILEGGRATDPARAGIRWKRGRPVDHPGYLDLLEATPRVLDALASLEPAARKAVRTHTLRTTRGMAGFVARADAAGVLRLEGLEALRSYCYAVAGIVGEMLTDLFLLEGGTVGSAAGRLRARAPFFGEALQLVNVLRDARDDAREGRILVDERLDRGEVLHLAYRDLRAASEYSLALQEARARRGVVAFTALPARLAVATLEAVRERGPGAKISRARVARIVHSTSVALLRSRPPVPLEGWPGATEPWSDAWTATLPPAPWEEGRREAPPRRRPDVARTSSPAPAPP